MALLEYFVGLLVLGTTLGATYRDSNNYLDTVLNINLQNEIRNLRMDPISLANFTTEIKDKVTVITVKVTSKYYDGEMTGLSQVQRWGNCSQPRYSYGNITINCTLAFNDLKVEYYSSMKYGVIPSVRVKGKTNITSVRAFVEFHANLTANYPVLKAFRIISGPIKMETIFSGLGPLNSFLSKLSQSYAAEVSNIVTNVIFSNFAYVLERSAVKTPLPKP
ncbi:uncharacterized protein LOC106463657 [Limulus polyphemus]|uniref:Uncharacterized protein LOC106463657 n=1 Tax=Limulus polyphemus TaxID=6850 RepID=A0ABM1BCD4_LIMPO|nr:uncharacterized protein LOC106463657 [Limulus polyphemus]XP_013779165.1 uncharacterized protein LOC106463657 [Limulus polyphemus]